MQTDFGSDLNFLKLSRCLSMALPPTGPSNPPCWTTIPAAISVWHYLWLCKKHYSLLWWWLFKSSPSCTPGPNSPPSHPVQTLAQPRDQFGTLARFARNSLKCSDDDISNLEPPVHPVHWVHRVHPVHPSHLLTQPLAQFGTLCKKQSSLLWWWHFQFRAPFSEQQGVKTPLKFHNIIRTHS